MAFEVRFTNAPNEFLDDDPTIPSAIGVIRAGTLEENFVSTLYEWNKEDYEAHWVRSLRHLLAGADRAVLITWYINSKLSFNLQWWALYRDDAGVVHIQNHLPSYSNFDQEFLVDDASRFLHDRITVSEEGKCVSEWDVPLADIEAFVQRGTVSPPTPL